MPMDNELAQDFLAEAGELLEALGPDLMGLAESGADAERINRVFRAFHTVKGGAGFLDLQPVVSVCHAAEDVVNALRGAKLVPSRQVEDALLAALSVMEEQLASVGAGQDAIDAPEAVLSSLRDLLSPKASGDIDEDEFEALLDQLHGAGAAHGSGNAKVEEDLPPPAPSPKIEETAAALPEKTATAASRPSARPAAKPAAEKSAIESTLRVETRRLDAIVNLAGELILARNRLKTISEKGDPVLARAVKEVDQVTSSLQSAVMRLRMQPIGKLFSRYPRIVRELARSLGKEVELSLIGESVELDKSLVEGLADPLVHLIRNSVDHGIESSDQRRSSGKASVGHVRLEAEQHGDHIVILIADDGAGIDPDVIRSKALEKGLIEHEQASRLTARECLDLIFLPGFSTKQVVTDVSGRGVGMDVVRSRLSELGGSVEIDSALGEGSRFRLRVPLTLAVLPALMLGVGGRPYAIPLSQVSDVTDFDAGDVQTVGGRRLHCGRQGDLPLMDLREWSGAPLAKQGRIINVRCGEQVHALLVDEVSGREEIVIKPLGRGLQGMPGFAGATVTGDGRVALIIDPEQVNQIDAR